MWIPKWYLENQIRQRDDLKRRVKRLELIMLDLNEEKERKQIWIIRWQSGKIRSEYGTYQEAKQVAEEIGGEYIIV